MQTDSKLTDATAADTIRPVVLFDGGCPLCRREIAHYRKLRAAHSVRWVDITEVEDLEDRYGVSFASAMARFHVRDSGGRWHTGAAAFVEMWSHLGPYRWLSRMVTALRLTPLLEWAYVRFARRRQRARCDDASCDLSTVELSRQVERRSTAIAGERQRES